MSTAPAGAEPFPERLARRDPTLFANVFSATSAADRGSLLALETVVRSQGDYAYLEIGSHMGGTLQPHCADPCCVRIFSIDKRTQTVADVRGVEIYYDQNSSAQMMAGLRAVYADQATKIVTFDCDAQEVPQAGIQPPPRLCFVDGEHTDRAAQRDFSFCQKVVASDGIIAFHDANLVFGGIAACLRSLREAGVPHLGLQLQGTVYAILLGEAIRRDGPQLAAHAQNETWFRIRAKLLLPWEGLVAWAQVHWVRLIWWAIGCRKRLREWRRSRHE